ncbi:MAG: hypothetical protein HDT15_09455 [Oscillibacter sp.]|nr:hypothetical protein [Oscillibacter sp.]MBD5170156.1 hypothetical protein [Oscillibacter sp.]
MSKKSISQKRMDREQQENHTLSRIYYVFLLGLIAEVYLFLVYRFYAWGSVGSMLVWHKVLTVLTWVGLAALVAGVAGAVIKRQEKKLRNIMIWVAGAGAFFFVSSWVVTYFFSNGAGVTAMCILVPILAVLALVYLLYQHECALCSVVLSGAMFSVWLRGASSASAMWRWAVMAGCILVAVILAAAIYLTTKAQKDGGKLWKIRIFSVDCDYRIVYAVLGVAAAALLLAAALPGIGYYLMWALGVLLFAELVFYTTKLM